VKIKLRVRPTPNEQFPWEYAGASFHVGRGDQCALRFQSEPGQLVSLRHALVELSETGCFLTDLNSTNGTYINGRPVVGRARLTPGDQIQLGQGGPRLEVLAIETEPAAGTAGAIPLDQLPREPAAFEPGGRPPPAHAAEVAESWDSLLADSAPSAPRAPLYAPVEAKGRRDQQAGSRMVPMVVLLAVCTGALIAFLAVAVAVMLLQTGRRDTGGHFAGRPAPGAAKAQTEAGGEEATEGISQGGPADEPEQEPQTGKTDRQGTGRQETGAEQAAGGAASVDEDAGPAEQLAAVVFLVQVRQKEPPAAWPFATASAVRPNILLTTATVVTELARFRQRGMELVAVDGTGQTEVHIDQLRVHAAYVGFDSPQHQIYVDLGLLTTREPLPATVPVADTKCSAGLGEGMPIRVVGYPHKGLTITKYDRFKPQTFRGRTYLITRMPDFPGQPCLLHVLVELPQRPYGSVILDADGNVVAVYAESAIPEKAPVPNLHYAAAVSPGLLPPAGEQPDENLWVAPGAHQSTSRPVQRSTSPPDTKLGRNTNASAAVP